VDRQRPTDEVYVLASPALERRGVLAAFTERSGGTSAVPYNSLNLGFRTGDDQDRVRANRERAAAALEIPPVTTARQVHGVNVFRVGPRRAGRGFDEPVEGLPAADVLVTRGSRIPLGVLVADCLPVILATDDLLVVVHAGWRGLAAGIIDRAVALFPEPAELTAALGPAIGPCHYEVGQDVAEAVAAGSGGGGARRRRRKGRVFLDLPGTAEATLRARGVRDIDRAEVCTACREDRFYSHRRDGTTGRQAAIAMRL
jgi:YfiH family protein